MDQKTRTANKKPEDGHNTDLVMNRSLSDLPDVVMEQILARSLLSTRSTARTCILSKQCLRLWLLIPAVDIDEDEDEDEDELACSVKRCRRQITFMNFLSMCLKGRERYNNYTLDKFRLRMRYFGDRNYEIISRWLSYASERNRNIKELEICFVYVSEPQYTTYRLPETLLSNNAGSLTILKLENVVIQSSNNNPKSLPRLRTMSLTLVEFSSNLAFLQLTSWCPSMVSLSLKLCRCTGSSQTLKLSSLSLESLEVMHCGSMRFQIEATNLKSFKLHGGLYSWCNADITSCENVTSLEFFDTCLTKTWLKGFPSSDLLESLLLHDYWEELRTTKVIPNLMDATNSIHLGREPSSYSNHLRLIGFLVNFDCSRKLCLHAAAPEALIFSEGARSERDPPLPNLRHLQVEISFEPTAEIFSQLIDSLCWMAPAAAVSIHITDCVPYPETELFKTILGSYMKD